MMKLVILTSDPFMYWVFENICHKMPHLLKKKINMSFSLNRTKIPSQLPTRSAGNSSIVDDIIVDVSNIVQHICTSLLENILNEVIYKDLQDDFILSPYLVSPALEQAIHKNPPGDPQHFGWDRILSQQPLEG